MDQFQKGIDRVTSFSDGVVAIAITLLVLPLTTINPVPYVDDLSALFQDNSARFTSFVISFLVIALFWLAHHRVFRGLRQYDTVLLWLNMFWLLVIVFIPFPTYLLGFDSKPNASGANSGHSTVLLYIATCLVCSALLTVMAWHIDRSGLADSADIEQRRAGEIRGRVITVLMALALLVTAVFPSAGTASLLLLILAAPIALLLRHKSAKPTRPGQSSPD